ncbi:MAG: S8 family serine peptidase [Candidatus Cloacimonadaceae bacterium]|jgi:subtilisin family serine protease|nr:S8 family serine peptidase [Candidatus Cloacimonadota bacterium]MDX9949701.1 S8 family serine peptidase [Candidatus Syntrophosphaera sp.]NLN85165.1 S8 family serine peptidase [Candidatus Cloacimonadota bacterium]
MRKALLFLSVILFVSLALSATARSGEGGDRPAFASDRIKIKLSSDAKHRADLPQDLLSEKSSFGIASLDARMARNGGYKLKRAHRRVDDFTWEQMTGFDRWFIIHLNGSVDVQDALADFLEDPEIEAAQFEYFAYPQDAPNDPDFNRNWGHNNIAQLPGYSNGHSGAGVGTVGFDTHVWQAWDQSQGHGSPDIVIAIIDTGVDYYHEDLAANCVPGWDYGSNDSNPMDDSQKAGHGTCCAGIAAAIGNNGIGVVGVAGGCRIMPLKVADNDGDIYTNYVANAITYAADNGADVISMSFGIEGGYGEGSSTSTDSALEYAYSKNVVMFAATANSDAAAIAYPANHNKVISVGAASPCGQRKSTSSCDGENWWGSNYGVNSQDNRASVDIMGPTILPTTDITGSAGYSSGNYYMWFNGTSCATPYVAGAAALVLSKYPNLTPAEVRQRLVSTATDMTIDGGVGWDRYTGYGLVNVYAALGNPPEAVVDSTSFYVELEPGQSAERNLNVGNTGESLLRYSVYRRVSSLDESFERGGYFPAEWTQENVSGSTCWAFLPGSYEGSPSQAYDGSLNARLFVASTSAATTKLISPALDLSGASTATLTFYHAQAVRDSKQDELRVYYRTSSSGSWVLLQTYTENVSTWTKRTINLPNLSSNYYIAFEGKAKYGRGVCIDKVEVSRLVPASDSWLQVAGGISVNGSVQAASQTPDTVTIGFDATGLNVGEYQTTFYVQSNSEDNDFIAIPCTMNVKDQPLPVELSSFTAAISADNYVNLNWVTQTETGVLGFYVLRGDTDDLAAALTVSPLIQATNSSAQQSYIFTDRDLQQDGTYHYWLQNSDLDGSVGFHGPASIAYSTLDVGTPEIPLVTELRPVYPNPFNPIAHIPYSLKDASTVTFEIYNVRGQVLRHINDGERGSGNHQTLWDGRDDSGQDCGTGIYYLRMKAGDYVQSRKMILCK